MSIREIGILAQKSIITYANQSIPYDLCVCVPIFRLLTVISTVFRRVISKAHKQKTKYVRPIFHSAAPAV